MVKIHPSTRQRFVTAKHTGDIVIDAEGPSALSQEVLPVIGGWTDYTGSGGVPTKLQMMFGGVSDELEGTDAWLEGARKDHLDDLGNRTGTTRQRRKKIHIDLSKNSC